MPQHQHEFDVILATDSGENHWNQEVRWCKTCGTVQTWTVIQGTGDSTMDSEHVPQATALYAKYVNAMEEAEKTSTK